MNYKTDQIIKTALPMLLYSLFARFLKLKLSISISIGIALFIGVRSYLRWDESHRTQKRFDASAEAFFLEGDAAKGAQELSDEEIGIKFEGGPKL